VTDAAVLLGGIVAAMGRHSKERRYLHVCEGIGGFRGACGATGSLRGECVDPECVAAVLERLPDARVYHPSAW
jgi:hypothetical protein